MKTAQIAIASLLVFASASTTFATPPPGKGQGQSPAKWDIKGLEDEIAELEKLAQRAEWSDRSFQELYRNKMTSARKYLDAIKRKDRNWPTGDYEQQLQRLQGAFDRGVARSGATPTTPPPPTGQQRPLSP